MAAGPEPSPSSAARVTLCARVLPAGVVRRSAGRSPSSPARACRSSRCRARRAGVAGRVEGAVFVGLKTPSPEWSAGAATTKALPAAVDHAWASSGRYCVPARPLPPESAGVRTTVTAAVVPGAVGVVGHGRRGQIEVHVAGVGRLGVAGRVDRPVDDRVGALGADGERGRSRSAGRRRRPCSRSRRRRSPVRRRASG